MAERETSVHILIACSEIKALLRLSFKSSKNKSEAKALSLIWILTGQKKFSK